MNRRPWLAALAALLTSGCFPYEAKISANTQAFLKANPDGLRTIKAGGRTLRYAVAGPKGKPLILLIHGSPGSWEAFSGELVDASLTCCARVAAVDRPGFGGSDPGVAVPSLEAQADLISLVIVAEGSGRPAVVLGHSLGGPVAARLAMDHPDLVDGLVLVAPSIDPDLEKKKWIQTPASWAWVRPLLPSALDVCNQEILPLKGQLELMLPLWSRIHVPVRVIQGMDDTLVPPGNAAFAERMIRSAPLTVTRVPGLNHFVPWARPDLLREALLSLVQNEAAPSAR